MMPGLNPRIEKDLLAAMQQHPTKLPIYMLLLCVVMTALIFLTVHGLGEMAQAMPESVVEQSLNNEAALECIRRCVPTK